MWCFQPITVHRETNSGKPQVKIRLAFHFVERYNFKNSKFLKRNNLKLTSISTRDSCQVETNVKTNTNTRVSLCSSNSLFTQVRKKLHCRTSVLICPTQRNFLVHFDAAQGEPISIRKKWPMCLYFCFCLYVKPVFIMKLVLFCLCLCLCNSEKAWQHEFYFP